jgi:hypothetical protein
MVPTTSPAARLHQTRASARSHTNTFARWSLGSHRTAYLHFVRSIRKVDATLLAICNGADARFGSERGQKLSHAEAHAYSMQLAERLANTNPQRYTPSAAMADRSGRLFIYFLRNAV